MPSAAIDACCLIDLFASGHVDAILRAAGHTWHLPVAVQSEVKYVRQPDPENPGRLIAAPVDLDPLVQSGVLALCQPNNPQEMDLFTQYAVQFRSDGEAMCLALAQARGWIIATDDRKAIRISLQAGLTVISCPQLLKSWVDVIRPNRATLLKALNDIQLLSQFRPYPTLPHHQWWIDQLSY